MTDMPTKEVAVVKQQATKALQAAEALTIKTEKDAESATDILSKIKTVGKMIKERKEQITKPLSEALNSARDLFKPIEQNHAEAERIIKGKLLNWQEAERKRIEKETVKVVDKMESGKMSTEKAVAKIEDIGEVKTSVTGKVGQISTREVPKYRVTNEEIIPREFCSPDMAKIKKALDAGIQVPGAEKYYEKVISAR